MTETRRFQISPYCGSHSQHPVSATILRYGADQSGTKIYRFNRFGYRGPEPSDTAKARILTSGCSYTIGEGLDYHETWASQFHAKYACHRGLKTEEVSLINLAQGGASNDYIARTVLPHLKRIEPDLVVILFTYKNRAEIMLDDPGHPPLIGSLGPWVANPDSVPGEFTADQVRRSSMLTDSANYYYLMYTDDSGLINALKNMLLVQLACCAAGIEYLFSWVEHGLLDHLPGHPNPVVRELASILDRDRFCSTAPTDYGRHLDLAADGTHPGPRSNVQFARDLFVAWAEKMDSSSAKT